MKRVTVYFAPELHTALKLKAAETGRSVTALVNEAVQRMLGEDAEDLALLAERDGEAGFSFEYVVRNLRRRGVV